MDQSLTLEILLSGRNVLLTGPAGSGKTYVLNEFIRLARREGKAVAVTASTGLAATHLNGTTIHSWSGIGIHDSLPDKHHESFVPTRIDAIKSADVLVIDEVSMLHDYRLDMVDEIARNVRMVDLPFGGLQIVLCGDFFQLPPINREDSVEGSFIVNAKIWSELDPVICYLNEQHRQNDDDFLDILSALRSGDIRRRHAEKLLARLDQDLLPDANITELHTTNIDVDTINARELDKLPGKEKTFQMTVSGKEYYVENLKRACLANETLTLKKGALVMTIKNNKEKKYVNGSLGKVIGFETMTGFPKVEFKSGRITTITPESWELKDGETKRAELTQVPLRLAWAITIHKSQGMTLDAARIDLRKAFVEGMGYVALSRVRSLETLSLTGINQMALKVSPEALKIDEVLRKTSQDQAVEFEYLRAQAKQRQKSKKSYQSQTWNQKVATMREKHKNAYRPWSEEDDRRLVDMFIRGDEVKIKDLTEKFGRHPGSIKARLKKIFGDDVVITKSGKS